MRPQLAILGSGPAGLLAALAAEQSGWNPVIYSLGAPSEMFGAMYLHRSIPELTRQLRDFTITLVKVGTRDGYAYNVYGDRYHDVSWDEFDAGEIAAWDLKAAYDRLWYRFRGHIKQTDLDAEKVATIASNYAVTLCSIPARSLCRNPAHWFESQKIWVLHGPIDADTNLMYYNGVPWDGAFASVNDEVWTGHNWYRYSQINGYQAWEYSHDPSGDPIFTDTRKLVTGEKPIMTNCDCLMGYNDGSNKFIRIGRFGKWTKRVLTHHAYEETVELLDAL